jgi:hypothetical protein
MTSILGDEAFAWWLVGLVDGEGHFGITRESTAARPGPYHRCVFRVVLAVADRDVLVHACERTGWGRIYEYSGHGAARQDYVVWTVTTKEVATVADFFDAHPLQSKKAGEFAIWASAARAQASRRPLGRGHRDEQIAGVMGAAYESLRALGRGKRKRAA